MRRSLWGHVINLSSTSGIRGVPGMEFYTSSKFALEGVMDSMRYSLAPYNISITNINSGTIKTPHTDKLSDQWRDKGSRLIKNDHNNHMKDVTTNLVNALNRKLLTNDIQTSEDIGHVRI
jgi:NAD(P)-dependent dehydrogenase (short-subunit alcohol dehydrogenase family)